MNAPVTGNVTGNCSGSSGSCTGNAATATSATSATNLVSDEFVKATVGCANATGGATTASLGIQLYRRDGTTPITSARQVVLISGGVAYDPAPGAPNASLTLGTVTAGSIIATPTTGVAWLVETDATGLFSCTATNTDDETVYFSVRTAGSVSDTAKSCVVLGSNSDSAAWSA